jgi:hypothetical protein
MSMPMLPEAADPRDQLRRLEKINQALMRRVERSTDVTGNGFSLFQKQSHRRHRSRERGFCVVRRR